MKTARESYQDHLRDLSTGTIVFSPEVYVGYLTKFIEEKIEERLGDGRIPSGYQR